MKKLSDPRFAAAVEELLGSYVAHGGINHIEGHNLPALATVFAIIRELEAVLFPGYYEPERLGRRNVRYVIGERCARIHQMLAQEVAKSLEHTERCETARIGRRCKLYQGVTIGALSVEKHDEPSWEPAQRHPTLEDNVTVYAGATILGGRTVIGEGSVIGGNVWLTRSVPPGTKVQIDPPYLVYRSKGSVPVKEPIDYVI